MKIIVFLVSIPLFLASNLLQMDILDAAREGNLDAAREMYQVNPDTLNYVNSQGYTPLILASYHNQKAFVEFLIDHQVDVSGIDGEATALQAVSYKGFDEVCSILLDAGANPDYKDPSGLTPLHYAAQFKHKNIVVMLLEYNADTSIEDPNGRTALDLAKLLGNREIVDMLEP